MSEKISFDLPEEAEAEELSHFRSSEQFESYMNRKFGLGWKEAYPSLYGKFLDLQKSEQTERIKTDASIEETSDKMKLTKELTLQTIFDCVEKESKITDLKLEAMQLFRDNFEANMNKIIENLKTKEEKLEEVRKLFDKEIENMRKSEAQYTDQYNKYIRIIADYNEKIIEVTDEYNKKNERLNRSISAQNEYSRKENAKLEKLINKYNRKVEEINRRMGLIT
ncbi:MAG: hypothetical protein OEY88_02090 [Candidatus Bathyarchaeota archaeon]|nr:hypothetical protein [Candidatus Bathyarchaeota archaeon]